MEVSSNILPSFHPLVSSFFSHPEFLSSTPSDSLPQDKLFLKDRSKNSKQGNSICSFSSLSPLSWVFSPLLTVHCLLFCFIDWGTFSVVSSTSLREVHSHLRSLTSRYWGAYSLWWHLSPPGELLSHDWPCDCTGTGIEPRVHHSRMHSFIHSFTNSLTHLLIHVLSSRHWARTSTCQALLYTQATLPWDRQGCCFPVVQFLVGDTGQCTW